MQKFLKEHRKEILEKTNISRQSIYSWESGKAKPSLSALKKLAVLFPQEVAEIINNHGGIENGV